LAKRFRKITRKRKGGSLYFNAETQAAIVEFQGCDESRIREKLYVEKIMPAFDKLAENLIFIYGFASPPEPVENLKNDCIAFLYETINKWDESKGSKAFSYFNVVAKNWLIINARRIQKMNRRHVSSDDVSRMSKSDKHLFSLYDVMLAPDDIMIKDNFKNEVMKVLLEIKTRVTGENEKKCIDAVIIVFEQVDQLDFLNKRAVFVYVRDISGLTPKQLSVSMSVIRKHYRELVRPGSEFNIF
tara:strand:+ start:11174 stop:11902 length:729 start_codon:yes stop_codon:yes gene_type:complete